MVIEVFGHSPRAGLPDTHIYTFASVLHDRDVPEKYNSREAYDTYVTNNRHNESRFLFPIEQGSWQDLEDCEAVAEDTTKVQVRGRVVNLPPFEEYGRRGIELVEPPQVRVFELCRLLADVEREQVLATPQERRISLLPDMSQLLQLEDWNHLNVVVDDLPSQSETFQQLAQVLVTGEPRLYRPAQPPNTHWRNWPDGGSL
jgi:hypothetical protein